MNYLFGKFNWSSLKHKSIVQDCSRFNNGSIDLHVQRTSNFNFDTKALFYNPTSNILCAMIGYISNLEKIKLKYNVNKEKDVEIIEKLYSIKKFEFILDLDGIFSIFIFDENIQKGYIFQDQYGSNLPIYYAYSKTDFVFSTTLKYLLKNIKVNHWEHSHESIKLSVNITDEEIPSFGIYFKMSCCLYHACYSSTFIVY